MARKSRKQPLQPLLPETEMQEKGFHAAIYLRLSMESYEEMDANSLGHQREICLDYLKDKPEIQVWETYMDNGFSGTNFDRTDFQRMVADIQSGTINCVVVKDLSRFGRNYLDVDEYLNEKFPQWGVRFISVLEGFDTSVPNKDGFLIIPFRNILNDYYARDFSQKIRSSILARMQSGEFVGNSFNTPYGYIRDGEQKKLRINPETAPVVQMIFKLRSEGVSLNRICTMLNRQDIPCPSKYLYLKGATQAESYADRLWNYGTVRNMTNNEVYLGHLIHHKVEYYKSTNSKRILPPEEHICIRNAHEPLVSQEVFDLVQQLNRESSKRNQQHQIRPKAACDFRKGLVGNIYCGDCGHRINFSISKFGKTKTMLYSRCTLYLKDTTRCSIHSISMEKLSKILARELNQQFELMQETREMLESPSIQNERVFELKRRLQSVKVKQKHVEGRRHQLMADYMDHILDKDDFLALKEKYAADGIALSEEEASIRAKLSRDSQLRERADQWYNVFQAYQKDRTLTNELLREVVDRVLLFEKNGHLTVEIVFRYQDVYHDALVYCGGEQDAD